MRLLAAGAVLAAVLALPVLAVSPPRAAAGVDSARALGAYAAMQRYLFDARRSVYREAVARRSGAHAWPASQAVAATIAVARVPGADRSLRGVARARLEGLERLRSGAVYAASAGGEVYYDDNEWIAQDLLDADAAWGDVSGLARAEAIFTAVTRAWDGDESHPCPGGVVWTTAPRNNDRNTVTTANGALLGLRLYSLTRRPSYLAWAQQMLGWLDRCMLAPNGLYWDHVDAAGTVNTAQWTYNQGSVIGANVLLYRETGDSSSLARAEDLADATLAAYAASRLDHEPPEFAAIFFRNLLDLAAVDHDRSYVRAAQAYADRAWARRDRRTNLVAFDAPTRLLSQAAVVQLYAGLARASP